MNERLKELRTKLGLSQEKFGERLGVTKSSISKSEKNERGITEQTIKLICREFNVDYLWLTEGLGEMFSSSDFDFMEKIDRIMFGENEFHKNLFKTLSELDVDELLVLENVMKKFNEIKKADD